MNFVIFVESNTTVIMPVAYCVQTQNLHFTYTFARYPVSVVYPKNSSDIWKVIRLMPYDVTYCESVFRKSLIENVEVFLAKGRYETTLTFV